MQAFDGESCLVAEPEHLGRNRGRRSESTHCTGGFPRKPQGLTQTSALQRLQSTQGKWIRRIRAHLSGAETQSAFFLTQGCPQLNLRGPGNCLSQYLARKLQPILLRLDASPNTSGQLLLSQTKSHFSCVRFPKSASNLKYSGRKSSYWVVRVPDQLLAALQRMRCSNREGLIHAAFTYEQPDSTTLNKKTSHLQPFRRSYP
jgi:hypothetical protein